MDTIGEELSESREVGLLPRCSRWMVGRGEKLGRRFRCVTCHFNDGNIPTGTEKAKFI